MEKNLIKALDNLTMEQTERLLEENMKLKVSDKDRNNIKNSVFKKIGSKRKKRFYVPKKLLACAAAVAVIFTAFSIVGFDNVSAAINKMFSLIPGQGIIEKGDSDADIYAIEPIVRQTSSQNAKANIVTAVYSNDYLSVTVEVIGKAFYHDAFSLYINQELVDYQKDQSGALAVSSDSTILSFSYKTKAPAKDDIYEIDITGFSERLSFKMIPCNDYDDIEKIGPTDTKNGISITTTAQRIDNQLIVWCYPFKSENATKDTISAYGNPSNGSYNKTRYIETESGQIVDNYSGWQINGRSFYDITDKDQTATLHIPYLSMIREEKKRLKVKLPKDYTTVESDVSLKCSLGTINVTEIKREPYQYEEGKDKIMLKFRFDSNDSNMALNRFGFDFAEYSSSAVHSNSENGCMEYLEVYVDKNDKKISLKITELYYYLQGEYVIPLDIK